MCYRNYLRQGHEALQGQQRALLTLEGFVALTLHTVPETLTVPIEREVGAQLADPLRETLRERRRALKTEAPQLRRDGGENAYRQGPASPRPGSSRVAADPSGPAPLPTEALASQS